MKWLGVGAAVAVIAVAVAVSGFAQESEVERADAVRAQGAAPVLPNAPAAPFSRAPKPRPQPTRRSSQAKSCHQLNDEDSDPDAKDALNADETRASCRHTDDQREDDEREADENEARDDHAGDDNSRDGNDDQAGDSDGSGD